jgi:hypothetical protein
MSRKQELVEQLRTGPWIERLPSEFVLEAAKDAFDANKCVVTIHEEKALVVKVQLTMKTISRYHWRDTIYTFTSLSCCITGTNFKSPHLCTVDEGFRNLQSVISKYRDDITAYRLPK